MVGDRTPHQARRVSDDAWVVSYLRGRMLTTEQAAAAIQAADTVALMNDLAAHVGLTALEAIGLAVNERPWEKALPRQLLGGRHRR
ncbi:hypothetical protein [Nocardia lijiangensis]|uniref:hypothetical protein n=1 Tax=Nocardia lijiangensis TaxID=299618 RepID=UPI001FE07AE7|nr:hypothetical protein [Nocardia lijiangensis]